MQCSREGESCRRERTFGLAPLSSHVAQKALSFGKADTNSDDVIAANDCVKRKIDSVRDENDGLIERV